MLLIPLYPAIEVVAVAPERGAKLIPFLFDGVPILFNLVP